MFKVECYTSSKLNERPVAFVLSNSRYKVEEIIDRWYGEGSRYFKIKADDDNIYLLKYDERADRWEWVFYQNPKMLDAIPSPDVGLLQNSGREVEDIDGIHPVNWPLGVGPVSNRFLWRVAFNLAGVDLLSPASR